MITVWIFVVMAVAPLVACSSCRRRGSGGSLLGFVLAFIVLFLAAGVGNGSTFRMIPIIFRTLREREVKRPERQGGDGRGAARRRHRRRGHAGLQLGRCGVRRLLHSDRLRHVDQVDGQPVGALVFFSVYYLVCMLVTWRWYARRGAEVAC